MNRRQYLGSMAGGLLGASGRGLGCGIGSGKMHWSKSASSDTPLFAFEDNRRVGFIDGSGEVVIPARFDAGLVALDGVGDFEGGLARMGSHGHINARGEIVIGREKALAISDFSEGIAIRTYGDRNQWIDSQGREVAILPPERLGAFSEGLIAAWEPGKPGPKKPKGALVSYPLSYPGKVGFRNRQGAWAIPPQFAHVGPFREGLARFQRDGQCFIYAEDGRRQGTPTTGYAGSCGEMMPEFQDLCRTGFLNPQGEVAIPAQFEMARDFSEGLAAARLEGRWGLIDRSGRWAIPAQFQGAESFSEGMAAVQLGQRWGAVDRQGKMVLEPRYAGAFAFSEGLAKVSDGRRSGYIDRTGQWVLDAESGSRFRFGLASIYKGHEVFYANRQGEIVFRYSTGG